MILQFKCAYFALDRSARTVCFMHAAKLDWKASGMRWIRSWNRKIRERIEMKTWGKTFRSLRYRRWVKTNFAMVFWSHCLLETIKHSAISSTPIEASIRRKKAFHAWPNIEKKRIQFQRWKERSKEEDWLEIVSSSFDEMLFLIGYYSNWILCLSVCRLILAQNKTHSKITCATFTESAKQ